MCSKCGGSGRIDVTETCLGPVMGWMPCPDCNGRKSNGPIKSLAKVKSLARTLQSYARIPRERDIAKLALRSPEAFLARPAWQEELIDAADGAKQEFAQCVRELKR
ncbi:hypothetical protein LCGC14_2531850 [marine sediment metagenome]|uniref:Uncharacterized protein n=1 Tax=marine sediment metagenome TaxID=412755 RepID=A0A0F9ATA9_9ZZZZ